jgi:hypothetical protein
MAYFQPKNSNLGKFWRVLHRKVLVYSMAIRSILRPFGIFCGHLVYSVAIGYYFMVIWYIFPVLVNCANRNLAILVERIISAWGRLFAGKRLGAIRALIFLNTHNDNAQCTISFWQHYNVKSP